MRRILAGLADLVFPPRCISCGDRPEGEARFSLCERCRTEIALIGSPLCPICGEPFSSEGGKDHPCGSCLVQPPSFSVARSLGRYDGILSRLIQRFKYQGQSGLADPLGSLLAEAPYPGLRIGDASLIVPVPLHPGRLRERGFNQSLLLARVLGRRHRIPVDARILSRPVAAAPQVALGRRERMRNVRGVFAVRHPERLRGKHILLVDDVFTTGSTLRECSRVLLRSGAGDVSVLTLARSAEHLSPAATEGGTGGRPA